ncbi:MAG: hypothetical protein QNL87_01200, partial [Gammaproteobacteria bacterium]|nr:hypothetical protein [Gammaproteobacteria bacterium]
PAARLPCYTFPCVKQVTASAVMNSVTMLDNAIRILDNQPRYTPLGGCAVSFPAGEKLKTK